MKSSIVRAFGLVLAMGMMVVGCADSQNLATTSTTTPTTPTLQTETFTGTLAPSSAAVNYHYFTADVGDIVTKVSAVTPTGTVVGIGAGDWNGIYCTPVLQNNSATTANSLLGTVTHQITGCLMVFDPGSFTETVTYTVSITHY
jgi:hypothetical protein